MCKPVNIVIRVFISFAYRIWASATTSLCLCLVKGHLLYKSLMLAASAVFPPVFTVQLCRGAFHPFMLVIHLNFKT